MSQESSPEYPTPGHQAVSLEVASSLTFQPIVGAPGPTHEHWLQYLVYIRGAVAALKFDDVDLTDRMRRGFDSDEDALEPVRAWAETEGRLAAAIELLRTAQARCTLAVSRVGTRHGRRGGAVQAKALLPTT